MGCRMLRALGSIVRNIVCNRRSHNSSDDAEHFCGKFRAQSSALLRCVLLLSNLLKLYICTTTKFQPAHLTDFIVFGSTSHGYYTIFVYWHIW